MIDSGEHTVILIYDSIYQGSPPKRAKEATDMHSYVDGLVATQRIEEAREFAARQRLIASLQPTRSPVRAVIGLALIRAGRWVAGESPRRGVEPYRAGV